MLTIEELILGYMEESQTHGPSYASERFRQRLLWADYDQVQLKAELQRFTAVARWRTKVNIGFYLLVASLGIAGTILNLQVLFANRLPERLRLVFCLIAAGAIVLSIAYGRYILQTTKTWRRCKKDIVQLQELLRRSRNQ